MSVIKIDEGKILKGELIVLILFILIISLGILTAKNILSDKLELYLKFSKRDGTPLSNAYVEIKNCNSESSIKTYNTWKSRLVRKVSNSTR